MDKQVTTGQRLKSMLIDHLLMTLIIATGFLLLLLLLIVLKVDLNSTDPLNQKLIIGIFLLMFSMYFNKDIINGQSPSKKILNHQIIDNKTGRPATPIQCVTRNLTLFIWPIEIIVTIINPTRRLGDFISNTKVVNYTGSKSEVNFGQIFISILIGLTIMTGGFLVTIFLQINFIEYFK